MNEFHNEINRKTKKKIVINLFLLFLKQEPVFFTFIKQPQRSEN